MIQTQRSMAPDAPFANLNKHRASALLQRAPESLLRCRDELITPMPGAAANLRPKPKRSARDAEESSESSSSGGNREERARQKRRRRVGGGAEEGSGGEVERAAKFVEGAAACQAVVVVGSSASCCMCHVARNLLCGLGANPRVVEAGPQHSEAALEAALRAASGGSAAAALPAVFIGGRLLGGVDQLLSTHLAGHLIPRLKEAGALWL